MGLFGNVSKISVGLFTSKLGIRSALICLKLLQIKIMCSPLSVSLCLRAASRMLLCVCLCVWERWESGSRSYNASVTFNARSEKDLSFLSFLAEHRAVPDLSAISADSFKVSGAFFLRCHITSKFHSEIKCLL